MKPFLIFQLRPETPVADGEYYAMLEKGKLPEGRTRRIRLDQEEMPDLDLDDYAGVIVGGGPGCVSDKPEDKVPVEARIEAEMLSLMPEVIARDTPFLGCCYGIGILGHHLGAEVSKRRYSEPVGPVDCELTEDGKSDPLTAHLKPAFPALVGHKEALQELPKGSVHLVSSGPCPYQMIRHGQNVYATQFHPEGDGQVFADRVDFYKHRGYFPESEAKAIKDRCLAASVDQPELILQAFVERYG